VSPVEKYSLRHHRRLVTEMTEKMEKLINFLEISMIVLLSSFSLLRNSQW
jgi:hypothetical protein